MKRFMSLMLVLVMLTPLGATASNGFDQAPRIAVISAFGAELTALRAQATIEKTVVLNGRTVYVGKLAGHKVILTLAGVSMTNAAMSTQAVLDHFNVTKIVFSGIAGGVNPSLNIGDVVVPAKWSEYQETRYVRQNPDSSFQVPANQAMPCFGMMCPQTVSVASVNTLADKETKYTWFLADPAMLAVAANVARTVVLDKCANPTTCLSVQPIIKVNGNGVSGPTFVDNADYRIYAGITSTWQADALDMESAAVAHIATTNGVPFIVFRSLSDLAGGGPGQNEIGTFFQLAANNSAKVMFAFLKALP